MWIIKVGLSFTYTCAAFQCFQNSPEIFAGLPISSNIFGGINTKYCSTVQGVCAILIFNKYTYFWQFAYLSLLSMWKYTYFKPKWMKRQKLDKIWRNCLQFMKYLDISMIFCSFSYMKSYVLLKTEQKFIEVRMEMSLWLKFFGAIF